MKEEIFKFAEAMEKELQKNSYKGDWEKWNPNPSEWYKQMQDHIGKLQAAIIENDKPSICEYSADVANYALKSFFLYGEPYEYKKVGVEL